jgi:mRNA interferase MazF
LVCSHDILNENSSRIIVAPITTNIKKVYSFEFAIKDHSDVKGKIMLDQMRSIDKSRLGKRIGSFSMREMLEIDLIIKFVLGIQQ